MKAIMSCILVSAVFLSCLTAGVKTLKGKIRVTGNEPFAQLTIQTEDGKSYVLQGDKAAYLRKEKQNQVVKIKGNILSEPKELMKGSFEVTEIEQTDK
jgi:hypothetical protein